MCGRLWAPASPTPCCYSSSCMARQNHRLSKTTAPGVFCLSGDPERQGGGTDIQTFLTQYDNIKCCQNQVFPLFLITSPSFLQYKHLFVHIGPSNPGYNDPVLESIDVRQIYDKFSEKKGGLKELYEKGPHNAFFLVKFWVSMRTSVLIDYSL